MNCDQVFAILTRGPFPSGDSTDSAVELHLSRCSECRHFADALRPDGSTDSESLIPEESRGLPYYWGVAALASGEQTGSLTATEGRRRTRRKRKPSFFERHEPLAHLSGWQLAFAVLMGALLGTLLRLIGYADGGVTGNNAMVAAAPPTTFESRPRLSTADRQLADKLGATPACRERRLPGFDSEGNADLSRSLSNTSGSASLCCTECHNSTSPRFALQTTTAKIVRSCQICHEENTTSQFGKR